jgi:hypothetical protein
LGKARLVQDGRAIFAPILERDLAAILQRVIGFVDIAFEQLRIAFALGGIKRCD